jgi:GTP pyrophosphokinase
VEIVTQTSAHPSEDWLSFLVTSRARQKVRHWLKEQRREDSISLGREMLARELKRHRRPPVHDKDLVNVAQSLGLETPDQLLAALGQGDQSVQGIVTRLHPDLQKETPKKGTLTRLKELAQRPAGGIRVQGVDNLMMRLSKCCQPVPGDQIMGIVTRGRGISVHRVDCPNSFEDRVGAERRVDVSWDVPETRAFVVKLLVYADDRRGILADLANAVSATGTNIVNAGMQAADGDARGTFLVEVNNLNHLHRVSSAIRKVKGVRDVERANTSG